MGQVSGVNPQQRQNLLHALVWDSVSFSMLPSLPSRAVLGDTFDSYQLLSPLIFCQDDLREGSSGGERASPGWKQELSLPPASPSPYGLHDHPQDKEVE